MESDIFKQFKEHSVAEFFKKNRQMLGFSGKVRSMTMIIHEFVTNSLDACEEAGILPEVFVQVEELNHETKDHYRITISDNGPGIPKTHLGKALGQMLAGTKFHRYLQQRGQQGIGAAACVMFSYLTTGQPAKAISCHKGKRITAMIGIDFKNNKPNLEILSEEDIQAQKNEMTGEETIESGLKVTAEYKDVRYEKSNYGIYEYLRRTALANPHCIITLIEPSGDRSVFPRVVEKNPQKPFEIKPHPLGIGTHDLLEFARVAESKRISSFLQEAFSRVSAAKVDELRTMLPEVNFDKKPQSLEWNDAEKIVKGFANVKWIAPATDSLVPIGKEQIEKSFTNIFSPEVLIVTERSPKVYRGGIPFMVEVGIAYGGGLVSAEKRGEVMRFANRVPLLFDSGGCAITETIKNLDWKRYDVKSFEEEPIAVLVNLISVHVPYTSAGKQAISNEEDIMDEIRFAIMEASRGVQRFLSGRRKANEIASKKKVVSRYMKQLAADLSLLTGDKREKIEQALGKIVEEKYAQGEIESEEEKSGAKENEAGEKKTESEPEEENE
ncbi:DNA topoisomerase VI subunit B [Candidatus Micrarchaeota archaeon]|nr:DNA topoisomerase VI subunit B [Candidatus Micrarchaeota archaeon]